MVGVREVAVAYYRQQATAARLTAAAVERAWASLDKGNLSQSYATSVGPAMVNVLTAGQQLAASTAQSYTASAVDAQGAVADAAGTVSPSAFAGAAADGRSLASLLYMPVIGAKLDIASGASVDEALSSGLSRLLTMVDTEVADAGRGALSTSMTADRKVHGYVRMVSGSACSRCIILAGRHYRFNASFQRHPRCFPAGVMVSGPAALAATRRWFEGELVVIRTASGQELPATGNHPILTDRGWLPANLLQEGDRVVRSTRSQGATPLVVPYEKQMPARIEDCWRPDGMTPLVRMPTSAEDFHGDGGHGDVDVVLVDSLLRHGVESAGDEFAEQEQFAGRIALPLGFAEQGSLQQQLHGLLGSPHGVVRGLGLGLTLLAGETACAQLACLSHAADVYASREQPLANGAPGDAESLAQAELAFASAVCGCNLLDGGADEGERWDPPAGSFSAQNVGGYAARGADLLLRLAGQVELDRVVEVLSTSWSGHVYNLDSTEGWYSANGLIVSNCHCTGIPSVENSPDLRTDPHAFFDHLSKAEQDARFGAADAEAIRSGADLFQVVNARRGVYTAGDIYGRTVQATREGITKRGIAGQRMRANLPAGRPQGLRLTVTQIFKDAGDDRDLAISLLKKYGYLI